MARFKFLKEFNIFQEEHQATMFAFLKMRDEVGLRSTPAWMLQSCRLFAVGIWANLEGLLQRLPIEVFTTLAALLSGRLLVGAPAQPKLSLARLLGTWAGVDQLVLQNDQVIGDERKQLQRYRESEEQDLPVWWLLLRDHARRNGGNSDFNRLKESMDTLFCDNERFDECFQLCLPRRTFAYRTWAQGQEVVHRVRLTSTGVGEFGVGWGGWVRGSMREVYIEGEGGSEKERETKTKTKTKREKERKRGETDPLISRARTAKLLFLYYGARCVFGHGSAGETKKGALKHLLSFGGGNAPRQPQDAFREEDVPVVEEGQASAAAVASSLNAFVSELYKYVSIGKSERDNPNRKRNETHEASLARARRCAPRRAGWTGAEGTL